MSAQQPLTSETYGMLKPREIREALRGKIDPEVGAILVRLCEDNRETRALVKQLATILDQWADIINSVMHISEAIKAQHEKQFGPMQPMRQNSGQAKASDQLRSIEGEGER